MRNQHRNDRNDSILQTVEIDLKNGTKFTVCRRFIIFVILIACALNAVKQSTITGPMICLEAISKLLTGVDRL